jgi:hypothetical protein
MTRTRTAYAAALGLVAALSLTGCGGGSNSGSTAGADPTEIGNAIKAKFAAFTKVTKITEDNDGNDLIGRPNGYDAAAALFIGDSLDSCDTSDPIGVDCGAVIERWPDESAAKSRQDYIQGILKTAPMLGTEYDTVRGRLIFRVSGDVKPTDAAAYKAAFLAAVG